MVNSRPCLVGVGVRLLEEPVVVVVVVVAAAAAAAAAVAAAAIGCSACLMPRFYRHVPLLHCEVASWSREWDFEKRKQPRASLTTPLSSLRKVPASNVRLALGFLLLPVPFCVCLCSLRVSLPHPWRC